MATVVIVNLNERNVDLIRQLKHALEKAGFSLTESYTSGVVSEKQSEAGVLVETIALVYNKNHEKP